MKTSKNCAIIRQSWSQMITLRCSSVLALPSTQSQQSAQDLYPGWHMHSQFSKILEVFYFFLSVLIKQWFLKERKHAVVLKHIFTKLKERVFLFNFWSIISLSFLSFLLLMILANEVFHRKKQLWFKESLGHSHMYQSIDT